MLKPHEDAYGRMVFDQLRGQATREVVERDDGFIDVGPGAEAYLSPFSEWVPFQRRLLRLCRGRVLDVGCGAGRAALALQTLGHDVLGIDNSPLAIRVCRTRGVKHARVMGVAEPSMRLGEFDSILMLGNNLGLLGGRARAKRLLRRWFAMTSASARIVGETLDPYATDDPDHLAYQRRNRARGRMRGQIRLRVRHRRYCTPWFDYLFVSRDEISSLARGTGWRVARFVPGPGPRYGVVLEKERSTSSRTARRKRSQGRG